MKCCRVSRSRRALFAALVALCWLQPACGREDRSTGAATLARGDLWIQDVTLVSPERDSATPHGHVVVRNGRIVSVGTEAPRGDLAGVTTLAGAGKFLAPGLIDGHVHLGGVPGMDPDHEANMPDVVTAYYAQLPRSYLYFGFTTVIDLNVIDRELVDRLKKVDIGPAVFDCDNGLSLANGYPMVFFPPSLRFERNPNFLYDDRQAASIPSEFRPEDHTPVAAVDRVARAGSVCVKAFYEPGFGDLAGKLPVPTGELMRPVRDASHARGLPLLLHANSLAAYRFAIEVGGVDVIVHGMWNWGDQDASTELTDQVRETLDAARNGEMAMMPTTRVIAGLAELFNPAFLDDPALKRVLPAELVAWYRTDAGQWFVRETAKSFAGLPAERARGIFLDVQARGQRAAVYFAREGGRILFGSDTPSAPTYANPPGYNGYLELRELEAAGISPRQLLRASTLENASRFRLAADYGTIEPGKVASLLLLAADPSVSTAAFETIDTVIVKGQVIPRATLAASP